MLRPVIVPPIPFVDVLDELDALPDIELTLIAVACGPPETPEVLTVSRLGAGAEPELNNESAVAPQVEDCKAEDENPIPR
jgi:hypothetical protein